MWHIAFKYLLNTPFLMISILIQMRSCDLWICFPIVVLCHFCIFKIIKSHHNFHILPILTLSGTEMDNKQLLKVLIFLQEEQYYVLIPSLTLMMTILYRVHGKCMFLHVPIIPINGNNLCFSGLYSNCQSVFPHW